jgi:Coenzyme PQQ synthesis protein D (PqqD)
VAISVTGDTILVQDGEPIPATVDQDVILLSIRAGSYFGLNRVGGEIWNMLAEPKRVRQICDALLHQHDVDSETVSRDVIPFLQTLIERRLIRVVDPGDTR